MSMPADALPLRGVKVVEFSHMIMGPSAGLILGDLGCDVIKVEPIGQGDNTRRLAGSGAGFFPTFNRNKRSIAVDLKHREGNALVQRLIATSDIVIENFRPGALGPLKLDYEHLAPANPRLIYCSLKGFLSGPYERRAALDEVVQMMGGLAYMTGPPGRPLRAGASVNDMMGGMFAVIGIMAALRERETTGRGQEIKSALFENNVWLMAPHMVQYAVTGRAAAPMPARISAWAVYDVFHCEGGEPVFVGVVSDTQWEAFCSAFEQPALAADPRLKTNAMRVAEREWLIPQLAALFRTMTRADLLDRCERAGLSFAPVTRPEDLFDDPHLNMPGAMLPVSMPDGRSLPIPGLPIEMAGERFGLWRDIPRVGQHGPEVAAELGLSQQDIERLITEGVLGDGQTSRLETDTLPVDALQRRAT